MPNGRCVPNVLSKENIKVNCPTASQEEVISTLGQMIVDSGYVTHGDVDTVYSILTGKA